MTHFFKFFLITLFAIAILLGAPILYFSAAIGAIDLPWLTGVAADELASSRPDHSERDRLRQRISEELQSANRFDVTLSEDEVNRILVGELAGVGRLTNARIDLEPQGGRFRARLAGRVAIPINASFSFVLDDGRVRLDLDAVSIGYLPLPSFALDPADWLFNHVGGVNQILSARGDARLSELRSGNAALRIAGYRDEQAGEISGAELASVLSYASGDIPIPRARAAREPTLQPPADAWKYLALGDSLSVGEGATTTANNYATGFWKYLESTFNVGFAFENFGIRGESTASFAQGPDAQLDRAVADIQSLEVDADPATRVHVITLSLGANDIFPILAGPACRAGPGDPECRNELDRATSEIEDNMNLILGRLREAAGPETLIFVTTYYDPFDFGTGLAFERLSDETMRNLNDRIVVAARANNVSVADAHALFRGLAAQLTHVLEGDVHPLDSGYGVLLLAFEDAYERSGPFS